MLTPLGHLARVPVYLMCGLVMTFLDLIGRRLYEAKALDNDDVVEAAIGNILVWPIYLPWNAYRMLIGWVRMIDAMFSSTTRSAGDARDQQFLNTLYHRYCVEARAVRAEPLARVDDWPSNWDLVMRLARAERADAAQEG